MKLEILGAYGGSTDTSFLTSFLVDDALAIDAGCLTQTLSLERQARIKNVLVSHSHLDHTLSLPFLVDNLYDLDYKPLRIWTHAKVIEALRQHIFNNVIWPDFTQLPSVENPSITYSEIHAEVGFKIGHFRVYAVPVNHVVPCYAFFVESTRSNSCVLFTSDTRNTDRIWEVANSRANLKAIILDCSFPNGMETLAEASGHMTPSMLARDLAKLKKDCDLLVYHIKPMFEETIRAELEAMKIPRLSPSIQNRIFRYGAS